ncbi:hypothetical protein [Kitasatospora sp. NPDC058190]|uniref:hypothetical protein n=1 Tax=Kitasatospora sp. NPDC058190 TaxID=3346371 RepID=UPI0036D9ECEA
MSDPGKPVPKDPPVPVEAPGSRTTGEGGPPPVPEGGKGPQAGPEYDATETAHALEPQVGSEPGEEPEATEPAREPLPHEPPD